ncbi:MAG: hypothetical protein JJ975_09540 [Bacteroidia bacterium]|nr:hypothetical protein [Bacteroidia bacterium]
MKYTNEDIVIVEPSDICSMFNFIENRMGYLCPSGTIEELMGYINGYLSRYIMSKEQPNPWADFEQYKALLSQQYKELWDKHNASLIDVFRDLAAPGNYEPVAVFWEFWRSYRNNTYPKWNPKNTRVHTRK